MDGRSHPSAGLETLCSPPPLLALSFRIAGVKLTVPLIAAPRDERDSTRSSRLPTEAVASTGQPAPELLHLRQLLEDACPGFDSRLAGTGEAADDALLCRWLASRRGDAEAAAAGLAAHVAWRCAFYGPGAEDGISEQSIAQELATEKVLLQGLDAEGHAVVVIRAARHDTRVRELSQTKRLICYVLDNASAAATASAVGTCSSRLCCILDLSGLRPCNLDYRALLAIFELLQQHFPERLHRLYFLNAPFIFWGLWRMVSPFIQPATRQKLVFVSGAAGRRRLLAAVPASVLPRECGGHADPMPLDRAVAGWRAARQAAAPTGHSGPGGRDDSAFLCSRAPKLNRQRLAAVGQRVSGAGRAAGGFVQKRLWRPARGAASAVGGRLPLLRRHRPEGGDKQQQQRALQLGLQVVLSQVLLLGLLLSVIGRVLASARRRLQPPAQQQQGDAACAGNAQQDQQAAA